MLTFPKNPLLEKTTFHLQHCYKVVVPHIRSNKRICWHIISKCWTESCGSRFLVRLPAAPNHVLWLIISNLYTSLLRFNTSGGLNICKYCNNSEIIDHSISCNIPFKLSCNYMYKASDILAVILYDNNN